MQLRPYQQTDLGKLRAAFANGAARICYQAPTGSGKTILFAHIVAGAVARGKRVIILGHRDEIVRQISEALTALGADHGIIAAGYPETEAQVQIASVATLVRRLRRLDPAPDLLVIDECHHAVAGTWRKIIDALPQAKVLGVTATPERLDGRGLKDIFDTLVVGPPVADLIKAEWLARFTAYAPATGPELGDIHTRAGDFAVDELAGVMSRGVVIDGAVDEYARLCPGAPAIVFCVDIEHSTLVAERFAQRGFRAAHVDGNTPTDERRAMIAALGTGELQVLCNCGLISEGLDVPTVVAAILLRPTKSLALYLQQVGRALRPAANKERALILDHSGNCMRFGLADAARDWSLDGRPKNARTSPVLRRCRDCGALNPIAAVKCSECGAVLRQTVEKHEVKAAPLVEVDREQNTRLAEMPYWDACRWAGADVSRLYQVAIARGYDHGWIYHRRLEAAQEARSR